MLLINHVEISPIIDGCHVRCGKIKKIKVKATCQIIITFADTLLPQVKFKNKEEVWNVCGCFAGVNVWMNPYTQASEDFYITV